jgi:hypothetical protein
MYDCHDQMSNSYNFSNYRSGEKDLPNPIMDPFNASNAASPPLEPPGVLFGLVGWQVVPKMGLEQSKEMTVCGTFVRQKAMAPNFSISKTFQKRTYSSSKTFENENENDDFLFGSEEIVIGTFFRKVRNVSILDRLVCINCQKRSAVKLKL